MAPRINRRTFVAGAGAAGIGYWVAPRRAGASRSPNEKLNVAFVGVGGRGRAHTSAVYKAGENLVALCDVNGNNLGKAAQKHPGAKTYTDFRRMYDDQKNFDAVVVATCEHTHAFATLPALKLRKHVYCEKPLTRDVNECNIIMKAAAEAKVATQMGTQMHATDHYRRVVELVQSGAVGAVSHCHVWVGRAWGRQSPEDAKRYRDIVSTQERPTEADPVPAGLDWDLWIGPAPFRPFNNVYFPGPKWYRWWDFGNGTMSDLGSHWNDLPFWALKLRDPLTIEADGPPPHAEIAPASMSATYTYGARGDMPPVKLQWHQGANKPDIWRAKGIPQWNSGCLFIGDKGMLLADYGKYQLLPKEKFKDFTPPKPFIPKSLGHHAEWIHACKTGAPTLCNFDYSGKLTFANHLGNVAYRAGEKLEWDAENVTVKNSAKGRSYLARDYRKGWSLA